MEGDTMRSRDYLLRDGTVQCRAEAPECAWRDPDGVEHRYTARCGNITRDPSGYCHRHRNGKKPGVGLLEAIESPRAG